MTRTAPPTTGTPPAGLEAPPARRASAAASGGPENLRADYEDLTGKTYRTLRQLIVTRSLPPGGKVTAEGLARRFGVSRTTVKGAIDQLAAEGLVEVRPQVGTFVRGLTFDDVRALWEVRVMLEVTAARRGVRTATEAQRGELRQLVDAMAPLVHEHEYREEGYERSVALNQRLHELIVETAGNRYLLSLYRQLGAHFHIVDFHSRRGMRRADRALAEHCAIVAAYEQRDPDGVATTLTAHVERSRDVVLQALARSDDVL